MKNFAKMVLFFSFSFVGVLAAFSLLTLLKEWTSQVLLFPPPAENTGAFTGNVVLYLERALPAAFYISILLGLSYAARRHMAYPLVCGIILVFSVAISGASYIGLESLKSTGFTLHMKASAQPGLVKPGFILVPPSGSVRTVFLAEPYRNGARITAIQGRPLSYQRQNTSSGQTLSFGGKQSPFLGSIGRDIDQSAAVFSAWFKAGFMPYGIYVGSLALFLLSLGCLVNISFWSLANLFFAALVFRGALSLEHFLNQQHIHRLLASFAESFIPESLVNPLIFAGLGILILLYSGLVYLARGKSDG